MTQKKPSIEKRQTELEVIAQALEIANTELKALYDFCIAQRRNALEKKPIQYLGLDSCDDIMFAGHQVEGAIEALEKLRSKAKTSRASEKKAG